MDPQEKERIAQEVYGKSYDQLTTNEQRAVGGHYRREQMGTEGYQEMGKKGGHTAYDSEEARRKHESSTDNTTMVDESKFSSQQEEGENK